MRYFKKIGLSFFVLLMIWNPLAYSQTNEVSKGAFILISSEGEVSYLNEENQPAPSVKVGAPIPPSYFLETGANGKLVGLLSNGTLLTLTENTRMKVSSFEQAPFTDDGRKLADLPGEPSQSKVTLDLDFGSLVVKTKKLSKRSSFNINSPVGVAGIRGTEFQMASNPGQGVQLDVTESTVAFTPPGGGQAIPVSQGNGLSVSPSGVATQRPVNPVVATKIESTNAAATEATQEVSLGEVAVAVEQSAQESESGSGDSEGDTSSEESSESEAEEEAPAEESTSEEGTSEESSSEETQEAVESEEALMEEDQATEASTDESAPVEEASTETTNEAESSAPAESVSEPAVSEPQTSNEGTSGSSTQVASAPAEQPQGVQGKKETAPVAKQQVEVQQPDQSQLLENNPELKKNQKLSKYGLSAEEVSRYDRLSEVALEQIENEAPVVVKRLLGIAGFEGEKSEIFFTHDREMKDLLLEMSDDVLITLLDPAIDEVLLRESLQKIKQTAVKPGDVPTVSPDLEANSRAIALGDRLRENGNSELMEELLEMSGGVLDDHWLRIGEVAEALTRDLEIMEYSGLAGFTREEALGNPFFPELANVYDQLELESLVDGVDLVMGADHLIVQENAQAFGSHFSQGVNEIVLMSRDAMEFRGDFSWEAPESTDARLVLMSANNFSVKEGMSLRSATSDLVIATRQNLLLNQVELDAAREVSIRGMRDVTLNQVAIGADELARIKARRDLTVDGLSFKRDVSRIVMEATTMRLRNVNFPGASQVHLNSLKGAIDGRYPNFGTAIPAAQQIGRVNFIENVRSGNNLLHDRPSFDLHGKNITIGKIANP